MLNENYYTKNAYEDNGRFQIHPLNSEGLEAYLSKDSYNYHYLKSKYDPAFLKEIQDEYNSEKKGKLSTTTENKNTTKNEQEKKEEDIKEIKNENKENDNLGKNKKPQVKKNNQNKKGNNSFGNKQLNKGNNSCPNNNNNAKISMTQKINNIGKSVNPVISNVNNDRGKLGDYQQPYHA